MQLRTAGWNNEAEFKAGVSVGRTRLGADAIFPHALNKRAKGEAHDGIGSTDRLCVECPGTRENQQARRSCARGGIRSLCESIKIWYAENSEGMLEFAHSSQR